jgi:membrane-associated protease RseP (regulator of RpoE activity)
LGHYLTCRYYRVNASPPYFLPAPTFIGTLGAFIRFRSPVHNRHELFDIGVAGPLAGFVMLLPALGIGLAYSRVVPGIAGQGEIRFGMPLLVWLAERAIFPGVHSADISLHPLARAAWVGLLATALNLLPIGQLDGGHLIYAWLGDWHKHVTLLTLLLLAPLGFLWPAWWLWVLVLFFIGRRHFAVFDPNPLSRGRRMLLAAVGIIFVLSFIPAPVMYNGEQGFLP